MKKGTRLLIAGILGIAVSSASTLAYFTSTATVSPNGGQVPLALNITNGEVEITAAVGNGTDTPTWTYDVARLSTPTYSGLDATGITAYEDTNRSMDIVGVTGAGRKSIGASVTGDISNARPGDALVFGQAVAGGIAGADQGLKIKNNATLTVKVQILVNPDPTTAAQLTALGTAGWVMYINNVATAITTPAKLQTELDKVATTLAPGASLASPLRIRLELPLETTDEYQGLILDTDTVTGGTQAFDVSSLFTIMATQENNPNWNEAGTP